MRLAPLLVLAACQDTGVKVHNTEPEVVFTDPVLALSVRSSEAVTFVANVEDGQTPTEDLTLVWASGSEGALEGTQALADTIVTFTVASFSAGEHVVTLTAIDADGASGSDAVTLDVTDNAPPAVAFSSPAEGDVLVASAPVAVSLVVSDEDDDLADVVLAWGGVAAGSADAPTAAAADGTASFDLPDLPAGSYTLSVSATDPHGDVATAEVGFTLVEGDLDSDGHVDVALGGDDCDDGDGGVHPGADERCDGVDEDCDGRTDEDAIDVVTVYDDGDGDGYGDAATEVVTCSPADGTVEGAGDCDDLDGAVHPAANEACNGVDDDCDGVTDVLGDADGDGWDFCDECDDGNPDVSPSAVEVCNGLDDDCDGATDGPDSADAATWYTDGDGDGYGDPDAPVRECSQPAGTLSDDSDCLDSDATVNPDGEETCNDGVDNDCDGDENGCGVRGVELVADAQAKLVGESGNDGAGSAVAGVGDFDGDGLGDLVVGADGAGTDAGAAYVVLGLPGDLDLAGADVALTGTSDGDEAGTAVGPAGDVDADGLYDVFVGAPGEDAGGTGAGAAYVITAAMSSGTLAGADVKLEGVDAGDAVGTSVAGGGDLDGDGWDDVATGAPGAGATDEGAVYLVDGPVYGTLDLATADATVTGAAAYDGAGEALALGDVDGDGFDDLIVGGPAAGGGAGVVWVLRGPVGGTTSVASADATWTGGAIPDAAGTSVSAGDVDGDGRADLVAGAPGAGAGETYVALDALAGGAFSGADLVASGEVTGDAAGTAVDALGDLDRDGLADVIIGAPEADTTERGAGAVYVIYAFAPGALLLDAAGARVEGEDMHGGAGVSAASAPDVDGDTYDDLVLGASGDDEGGSGAGAAYLLLGGGF